MLSGITPRGAWIFPLTYSFAPVKPDNMSNREPRDLIQVPPVELMGAAMRALNERQRYFVCALMVYGGEQSEAYRAAGYEVTNDNSAAAAASRLARNDGIVAAIKEEAMRRLDSAPALAVSTLVELASYKNSDDKVRLKAANSILDRVGGFAGKSEQHIVIKDERTTKELVDFIKQTALANGLDPIKLLGGPVVDVEFSEVIDGSEGLEDLL
jgi:phage terminase small subunit